MMHTDDIIKSVFSGYDSMISVNLLLDYATVIFSGGQNCEIKIFQGTMLLHQVCFMHLLLSSSTYILPTSCTDTSKDMHRLCFDII